ncbi:Sucrase/ferredoxin-like-domain-containing protein [Cladorrhinum sp. PSN259]|nr:Sucrase/ferredoxin-like-domain-containing protein [Cladorrhinum sp. PSN259]
MTVIRRLGQACVRPTFALRTFATKAPSFPTIPTCPSPTCSCAPTPEFPPGFEIDRKTNINGLISNYAQHVLVCTGKDNWPSRIEDDNSGDNLAADLRELVGRGGQYSDPFHNISVLNASFPSSPAPKSRPELQTTSAYLLPDFKYVPFLPRVSFDSVEALVKGYLLPEKLNPMHDGLSPIHRDRLLRQPAYQNILYGVKDVEDVVVLICGHGGRDQRCGIYGPLLRGEFEKRLPEQGLDVLTGPVEVKEEELKALGEGKSAKEKSKPTARVGLISHIGGHKFAGNVIIYLPPGLKIDTGEPHPLRGHGIWYGRVEPRHVEGITFPAPQYHRQLHASISLHRQPSQLGGEGEQTKQKKTNLPKKTIFSALAFLAIAVIASDPVSLYLEFSAPPLSQVRFKPFKVVAREQISSTAFIITVQPQSLPWSLTTQREVMKELLRRGVWAVEIKQPQLQVARDYTPLPPLTPQEEEDMIEKYQLRFLIRRLKNGEVSTYISRLQIGDQIELRGPKLGFDINARLGDYGNKVVFTAGGTGIASALQVAKTVLDSRDKNDESRWVTIHWDNRRREDCDETNQITRMLNDLKTHYGPEHFQYIRRVDNEGIIDSGPPFPAGNSYSETSTSEECIYHSPTKLITSPAEDPETMDITHELDRRLMRDNTPFQPPPKCQCPGKNGKNLHIVSGPDGYIEYWAGTKIWAGGKELQGPVGGVLGVVQKTNADLGNALVLKM